MNDTNPKPGADGAADADVPVQPVTADPEAPAAPAPEAAAAAPAEPAAEPAAAAPAAAAPAAAASAAAAAADPVTPVAVLEPVRPLDAGGAPGKVVRRQNTVAIVGTVALVVALAFGGGFASGRVTAPAPDGAAAVATNAPVTSGDPSATDDPSATSGPGTTPMPSTGPDLPSDGARLGRADAPVVIDYWADYQCPFCSKFAQEVIPTLFPRIEDGTVQLIHRDFAFIGPESMQAAIAVRCADREDKYWWMHDAVYAAQDGENQGAYSEDKLVAIAASIGLDTDAFQACMADRSVSIEVMDDTAAGHRVGVDSTPTADVNGTRIRVPDAANLEAAIAAAVAGATPGPLPTQQPTGDPWAAFDQGTREAGQASAPLTVELWMDYQATDSKAIVEGLEPELRTRAEDGRIRVVQKDLALLGEESVTAASAVRCIADQGGPAWLMHDVLAVNAQGAGSGIYTTDAMLGVAIKLGRSITAFDACMSDPATAAAIAEETASGQALGLEGGPAVIVRKGDTEVARFTGAIDPAKVVAAIDGAR